MAAPNGDITGRRARGWCAVTVDREHRRRQHPVALSSDMSLVLGLIDFHRQFVL